MRQLAQSQSYVVMLKVFLSSDHVTAATGKTVAIKLSKAGGAFADPEDGPTNATEVSVGWYSVTLAAQDTDTLGDLVVRGTSESCDDSEQVCQVSELIDFASGSFGAIRDLYVLHGLDLGIPVTVTPTSRTAGTIVQDITGDGTTTSTVTRTA